MASKRTRESEQKLFDILKKMEGELLKLEGRPKEEREYAFNRLHQDVHGLLIMMSALHLQHLYSDRVKKTVKNISDLVLELKNDEEDTTTS